MTMLKRILLAALALTLLAMGAALAEEPDIQSPPSPDLYSGSWACDRASIEMNWEEEGYRVLISWGSSAWENSEWEYSCYYHEEDKTLVSMPFGSRTDYVYGDDGELVSATEIYSDGSATFSLDGEGKLIWQDEKENAGDGMRFERIPDAGSAPLFGTLGQAMEEANYDGVAGGDEDRFAILVEKDGVYYRVVALLDEEAKALNEAIFGAEDIDAAMAAFDAKVKTLPVDLTEEITAAPKAQAELDTLVGKTLSEAEEAGYTIWSTGYNGEGILIELCSGLFTYNVEINESNDEFIARYERDDIGGLTVKSVTCSGISRNAVDLDYRADGTYDAPEDGWSMFNNLAQTVSDAMTAASEKGELDTEALIRQLTEIMPEHENEIRMLVEMFAAYAAVSGD